MSGTTVASPSNTSPVTTSTPLSTQTNNTTETDTTTKENEENNLYSYIFIAILSVVLILLLYYAYNRFVTNSVMEPFAKGNQQERDDPVVDFNLREAIEELRRIQAKVLKTLSESN